MPKQINLFALSFTPDGLLLPKLKELYNRYIDEFDDDTRQEISEAYNAQGDRNNHIEFYRNQGLPIWDRFLNDLARHNYANRDFEPFGKEIINSIEKAFATANSVDDKGVNWKSTRFIFGVVCLLIGFSIPVTILFSASYWADQATQNVSDTVTKNLNKALDDFELPKLISGCESLVSEIEQGDRNFSKYETAVKELGEDSNELSNVLKDLKILSATLDTFSSDVRTKAPTVKNLLEALKSSKLQLGNKKVDGKDVPDVLAASKLFETLKKDLEAKQLNEQIEGQVAQQAQLRSLFEKINNFSKSLPSLDGVPLPHLLNLAEEQVLTLSEIEALVDQLKEGQFAKNELEVQNLEEIGRELKAKFVKTDKQLNVNGLLNFRLHDYKAKSIDEFDAVLGSSFVAKIESLIADDSLLSIKKSQCDALREFTTTLDNAISAVSLEAKAADAIDPFKDLLAKIATAESKVDGGPFTKAREEKVRAGRFFSDAETKLAGLIESFKKAEDATVGLNSISDTVRDLTFRSVSPVMILLVIVSGLFITIGVTSLATFVKSNEYKSNQGSWRTNARLYAEIAAAFGAQGYDAAAILRLMQDEAPRLEKPGTNLATPVTQILSEGRRIVREFKKL